MGYSRGARMKLAHTLAPREKRGMAKALTAAQEAVEAAEEARNRVMKEQWERGLPLTALLGSTGLGYETVRKILKAQGLDIDPE